MTRPLTPTVIDALAALQSGAAVATAREESAAREIVARAEACGHEARTPHVIAIRRFVLDRFRRRGIRLQSWEVQARTIFDRHDTAYVYVEVKHLGRGATRLIVAWDSRDAHDLGAWIEEVAPAMRGLVEVVDKRGAHAEKE